MSDKVNTPDELEALKAENAELKAENADLKTIVKEQAEELEKVEEEVKASGRYPAYEVGKKTYELVTPKSKVRFGGKMVEVTAKSLKEDKKLLAHCVEKGFGCLREKGAEA